MGIIDLIIIILTVVTAVLSARKGFLKSLLDVISYIVAGILVRLLSPSVSSYLYGSYFSAQVGERLEMLLPDGKCYDGVFGIIEETLSLLPEELLNIAKQFGVYPTEASFRELAEQYEYFTVSMIEQHFIEPIIKGIISVITAVCLFIVFLIALKIVSALINSLLKRKKHSIIKSTNTVLGAALGVVKGCVYSVIICFMLNIIAPLAANPALSEATDSSYFCNLVADLIK